MRCKNRVHMRGIGCVRMQWINRIPTRGIGRIRIRWIDNSSLRYIHY